MASVLTPSQDGICDVCKRQFRKAATTQTVCSLRCAQRLHKVKAAEKAKREKEQLRQRKEKAKPRSKWLAEAQAAFNLWIRLRDKDLPCVSCGRFHEGQWHAGHYMSTGARPELRFDESNAQKQCAPCNTYLSGNLAMYRIELIRRIGLAEVERLEGPQVPRKYTVDELRAIKEKYRLLCK